MSDMLSFCLGLLSGFSSLIYNGPLMYLFGIMLFSIVVRLFLSIVFVGARSDKSERKEMWS